MCSARPGEEEEPGLAAGARAAEAKGGAGRAEAQAMEKGRVGAEAMVMACM